MVSVVHVAATDTTTNKPTTSKPTTKNKQAHSKSSTKDGLGRTTYDFCAVCHGETGEGKPNIGAPQIASLSSWYVKEQLLKFRSGVRGTHPRDVAGMRMRPMARYLQSDAQIDAVSEYVAQLRSARPATTLTGSWVKGQVKYQLCMACHGADGKGNEALKAPSLVGRSDWYLLLQLQNYKTGVRGASLDDPVGMSMRPITLTLSEQDMKDVVVYISGLR